MLVLLDGSALAHRAYYGTAPLTRSDGVPVGATYSYCRMLWDLRFEIEEFKNAAFVACFDPLVHKKTFRHDILPDYKANRKQKDEELQFQLHSMRQATEAFGIPYVHSDCVEADDLIATYVSEHRAGGWPDTVAIVSYDKDLMQLIDLTTCMFNLRERKWIGPAQVKERFGVEPNQMPDVLALIGDAVDNIPGVRGVGEKKASELIRRYGNLEMVLASASSVKWPAVRKTLSFDASKARLAKAIIQLRTDIPLPMSIRDVYYAYEENGIDAKKLLNFFSQMEFKSLMNMVTEKLGEQNDRVAEEAAGPESGASPTTETQAPEAGSPEEGGEQIDIEEAIARINAFKVAKAKDASVKQGGQGGDDPGESGPG